MNMQDDAQQTGNSKVTFVTKDGFDKLEQELETLKNVRRKEVAEHIKEAISYGDLSENSEYEEAKNEQAFVEGRILELEDKIKTVKIIADKGTKGTASLIVQLGSTVELKDADKSESEVETYTLVGSTEADPFAGKISNESPLGQALLERKAGDLVEYSAPKGQVRYKLIKVS